MSKLGKTTFERSKNEFYPTPLKAIEPLLPHLPPNINYCEPCAGAKDLVNNLKILRPDINCTFACDIDPRADGIVQKSAITINKNDIEDIDYFITNPPFKWDMFEPLTEHLISLRPTWLLIPSDYMHNKRMGSLMKRCEKVVSVGRVKWFSDSNATSTDNFCWYLFNKENTKTIFYGRDSA